MPRAAGDGAYYVFRLYNQGTGRYDHNREIRLASVTTVIKATLAAPLLVGWSSRITRDHIAAVLGMLDLTEKDEDGMTALDYLSDGDLLYEFMVENRLMPDDVKEEGGEAGKENHAYLERLAAIALNVDDEAADRYAAATLEKSKNGWERAIAKWWLERQPTPVASEEMLFSLRYGFAGTIDLCLWDPETGEYSIVDLKCRGEGRTAYESDHVQTGAYAVAWEEMFGQPIKHRSVLVARSDGTYVEEPSFTDPADFLHLLHVWDDIKKAERNARLHRKQRREVK
jgi:PD-(D/E)XK nuclease superfamily protein